MRTCQKRTLAVKLGWLAIKGLDLQIPRARCQRVLERLVILLNITYTPFHTSYNENITKTFTDHMI